MTMVAGGGDNRHRRTCLRIRKRLGHLYQGQYMKDMIVKIRSCSIGWRVRHVMSQRTYRATDTRTFSLEEELV